MQGGPTAALGEADVGKVVPSVRGGPPCWQHRGCAVGPGGPLESRAHLCGLDPSAVPFPPGRAAGRESLRRVFCAPELPPRVPGPRARIPLLRLEDKPPGPLDAARPPLVSPASHSGRPCAPGRRLGAAKPQAGREGDRSRPTLLLPTFKGRPRRSPPDIKRAGESAASARAGAGSALRGNHFNRGCSAFSPKECFECSEFWNIQTPRGRRPPRHHPGGAAASLLPGWAGGARQPQGSAPWPHGVACPHCRAIRS